MIARALGVLPILGVALFWGQGEGKQDTRNEALARRIEMLEKSRPANTAQLASREAFDAAFAEAKPSSAMPIALRNLDNMNHMKGVEANKRHYVQLVFRSPRGSDPFIGTLVKLEFLPLNSDYRYAANPEQVDYLKVIQTAPDNRAVSILLVMRNEKPWAGPIRVTFVTPDKQSWVWSSKSTVFVDSW